MTFAAASSDRDLLDLLRQRGPLTISQLTNALSVTQTAVRQRLTRLMGEGLIQRASLPISGRGRPGYAYSLTEKALRQSASNFADLAIALWNEIRTIDPPQLRNRLLEQVLTKLADQYRDQLAGATLETKLGSLKSLLRERGIGFDVETSGGLPVLSTHECPYPGLAEADSAICELETELFSKILGQTLHLSECRLHGHSCCRFAPTDESVAADEASY